MVIFVCSPGNGFPNGRAETARVTNLAKGLRELGEDAYVVCHLPSEDPCVGVRNTMVRGEDDGVPFEYTCGTTVRGATFVARRWLRLVGYARAAWVVRRRLKDQALRVVYLYQSDSLVRTLVFLLVARLARAIYVTDMTELPFYYSRRFSAAWFYAAAYRRLGFRMFDGALAISAELERYLRPYMAEGARLLRMPILVDTSEFEEPSDGSRPLPNHRYVMYLGPLNEYKDGVRSLVRAFAQVAGAFPDVHLALVGGSLHDDQTSGFRGVANELGIPDRVMFTGPIDRVDVPRYLHQATVLALARPASKQAEHNLPTKLGEYLATGKPVLLTRAGEAQKYLDDGVSAFFAPAGDIRAFANRLSDVLATPQQAREVGYRGREVARKQFDYRRNAERLHRFLLEVAGTHLRASTAYDRGGDVSC